MVSKVDEDNKGDCAVPEVWTFKNDDVADKFQHHVNHQLPWYNTCTEFVQSLIKSYVREGGLVYDIGCSKGNVTKALVPHFQTLGVETIGIENSKQMAAQYQGAGECVVSDAFEYLCESNMRRQCDVAVCYLSLMFMRHQERRKIISQLKSLVREGGCVIVVDKEEQTSGYLSTALSRARLALKENQGVPHSEIAAKELSLAGVQRPVSQKDLGDGWVEFFRMGEFVGWIYEG